jgi:hypothetical protein
VGAAAQRRRSVDHGPSKRSRGDGPTCTSSDGQPFGLIHGIALLNHSPFASFHVWLAAMLLQASSRWP